MELNVSAPYKSGYCFLAVINAPRFMEESSLGATDYDKALQKAFIRVLEGEFIGLDGIEDVTSDNNIDIADNISAISYIGKANMQSNGTFNIKFAEKAKSLVTTYISRYLKCIRYARARAKAHNEATSSDTLEGTTKAEGGTTDSDLVHEDEVFNFLYIVVDATCFVEKAFLILNAQPIMPAYKELYNMEKGREISVPFNGFIYAGDKVNSLATKYVETMTRVSSIFKDNSDKYQMNRVVINSIDTKRGISDIIGNHLNFTNNPTLSFKDK